MATKNRHVVATWEQINIIHRAIKEVLAYCLRNKGKAHGIFRATIANVADIERALTQLVGKKPRAGLDSTHTISALDWLIYTAPITVFLFKAVTRPEDNNTNPTVANKLNELLTQAVQIIEAVETKATVYYTLSENQFSGIMDIYVAIDRLYTASPEKNEPLVECVRSELTALQLKLETTNSPLEMSLKSFGKFYVITVVFSAELKASRTLQNLAHHVIVPTLNITYKQRMADHIIHNLVNQPW